jgi:hypothetical protein
MRSSTAYRAVLPEPATALPSANALTSLSTQLGRIVGPALGAAIVATGDTAAAFALDGLSFFVSAACLVPLVGMPAPERSAGGAARAARRARHAHVGVLGFLYACFAAGYVLADMWLGRCAQLRRRGPLIYGA